MSQIWARNKSRSLDNSYSYSTRATTGSLWVPAVSDGKYFENCHEGSSHTGFRGHQDGLDHGQALWIQKEGYTRYQSIYVDRPLYQGSLGAGRLQGEPTWMTPYGAVHADAFGATAIARSAPTNHASNVQTAVTELALDGLPRFGLAVLKDVTKSLRNAGDDFLNIEFGWKPLIKDLLEVTAAVRDASKIADQYVRDANRPIRRRYSALGEPEIRTQLGAGSTHSRASLITSCSKYEMRHLKRWFSGCFKYYVPTGNDYRSKILRYNQLADHLFSVGPKFRPGDLWEVAPWSWLVDWFSNVGDVLHNAQALQSDGLVMQYGYAMTHSIYVHSQDFRVTGFGSGSAQPQVATPKQWGWTYVEEHKIRDRANPYGFGLTDAMLSTRQLAILAALGLSRS